jgi:hypothetical protein
MGCSEVYSDHHLLQRMINNVRVSVKDTVSHGENVDAKGLRQEIQYSTIASIKE